MSTYAVAAARKAGTRKVAVACVPKGYRPVLYAWDATEHRYPCSIGNVVAPGTWRIVSEHATAYANLAEAVTVAERWAESEGCAFDSEPTL